MLGVGVKAAQQAEHPYSLPGRRGLPCHLPRARLARSLPRRDSNEQRTATQAEAAGHRLHPAFRAENAARLPVLRRPFFYYYYFSGLSLLFKRNHCRALRAAWQLAASL